MKCSVCGVRLPDTWEYRQPEPVCFACEIEDKSDHWTFSEDTNPNPQAGYKCINLDAFFRKFPELIEWHDRITQRGSFAQKIGIPNWAVVAAWKAMIEHRIKDKDMHKQGAIKLFWNLSNTFFRYFHRFWYEGPLK